MRQGRIKALQGHAIGYYHCISRVAHREFLIRDAEKGRFVALMREYEEFCRVKVLDHCIMSNHFHILVAVPRRPDVLPTDEELIQSVERLTSLGSGAGDLRQRLERYRQQGDEASAEALRERFFSRMWDVSAFMKELKQRFTQWYNGVHDHEGTLWQGRFRSVLVEGAGNILATMAAYIDLNSIRAKIRNDPADYLWCGYAQALRGDKRALEGLAHIVAGLLGVTVDTVKEEEVIRVYRQWLYEQGEEKKGADGEPVRPGLSPEAVAMMREARGRVPLSDYLRHRVRYFSDAVILGTKGFVNEVFEAVRTKQQSKRRDGARRMRGLGPEKLYVLRDLQVNVFTPSGKKPGVEPPKSEDGG